MHFAEFFAGVGLVNEGLIDDGWECVWANDISSEKYETYQNNYGKHSFHVGDIWELVNTPENIPSSAFLYTASFPCTDLSLAGERKGLAGEESGTLKALLEIVESKNKSGCGPKIIMLENVQGFLTSHNGADVAYTVSTLNKQGYVVDIIEMDAIHFTPQSRPSVFLFAVAESLAQHVMRIKENGKILDDWWIHYNFNPLLRTQRIRKIIQSHEELKWGLFDIPPPPNRSITLASIIEVELDSWWNKEKKAKLFNQMTEGHKNTLTELSCNAYYSYATVYRRMRMGESRAELRTDGVAGCLRTPRGGSSKQILIRAGYDDWSARLLSPREYARLQGVRDSFKLPENPNKAYFAMGDAVCVPAIKFISNHIITPAYLAAADPQKSKIAGNSLLDAA